MNYRKKAVWSAHFKKNILELEKVQRRMLKSLEWLLCLEPLSSLAFTSQEKRQLCSGIADLQSRELEKAGKFTLSSHTWIRAHQTKLVGDTFKACKDTVDAKSLSSSKEGWTNAWKRNPQATRQEKTKMPPHPTRESPELKTEREPCLPCSYFCPCNPSAPLLGDGVLG